MTRIALIAVLAIVLLGALVYSQLRTEPLKVSGFIEADEIRLGSRVGGRVMHVKAYEGQQAVAGDVMVELEPFDLHERRSEAIAMLAQRRAVYEKLKAGFRAEEIGEAKARRDQLAANLEKLQNGPREEEITAARAQLTLADAELKLAKVEQQRVEDLYGRNASTLEELDRANTVLRTAQSTVDVRSAELQLLEKGTRPEEIAQAKASVDEAEQIFALRRNGYRSEEIAEAEAAVDASQATLDAIEKQIAELTITTPVNGVVEAIELQPGDLIAMNAPALSLIDTSHLWVRTYVPEDALNIKIGQPVTVTVDAFPGRKFRGEVTFVARDAEFTPDNVQTPEDRSKLVFRVKVNLVEGLDVLRAGMAADVWLDADAAP